MDIESKLTEDLKTAMRTGDEVSRDAIRMLRAALKKEQDDARETAWLAAKKGGQESQFREPPPLTEEAKVAVVSRLAKRHRESIEQFTQGNRPDLVAHEQAQLAIVERYLPTLMPREDVEKIVLETLAGMDLAQPRAQGAIMAALAPKLRGKADMKLVNEIVREQLAAQAAGPR